MSEYKRVTRADKHTKRRKNNRIILIFIVLAVVFLIILLSLLLTNNKSEVTENDEKDTENITSDEENAEEEESNKVTVDDEQSNDEADVDDVDEIDDVDDIVIQQMQSTDENVIEAYAGNWPPIETEQQEPHTVNYNEDSDDRKEIKQAVSIVTGIEEENIVEHWVGNDGDQKVVATVSSKDTDEHYHVYVTWIEQEGWQVTKVERIKQFEKKQS